jgi:hypothetical protein
LPKVGWYWSEIRSLSPWEKHSLGVLKNKALRTLRSKERQVTQSWKKMHKEELYNLNSSPDIIREITSRRMRQAG